MVPDLVVVLPIFPLPDLPDQVYISHYSSFGSALFYIPILFHGINTPRLLADRAVYKPG